MIGLNEFMNTILIQIIYKMRKHWDVLDNAKLFGESLCQVENDY